MYNINGETRKHIGEAMNSITKITLALLAAAFISTPALSADTTSATTAAQQPNLTEVLKGKAANAVDQAKQKADSAAEKLKGALGAKDNKRQGPCSNATLPTSDKTALKGEVVDVDQQTVTVETPNGIAQETVTTITPEGNAAKTGEGVAKDVIKNTVKDAAGNASK